MRPNAPKQTNGFLACEYSGTGRDTIDCCLLVATIGNFTTHTMKITLAHSPDSDDAFMHYALARHKLDVGELEFEHVLQDIETLNRAASSATYDVTTISTHAYAYLHDKYDLLPHVASMGEKYGPMIVARQEYSLDEIKQQAIAVPGTQTSAYLALKLFAPEI